MSLTAQINVSAVVHESDDSTPVRSMRVTNVSSPSRLTDGTGANKAQVCWTASGTVGTAATVVCDLRSMSDDRGVVVMSAVKGLYLKNTGATNLVWDAALSSWDTGPLTSENASLATVPGGTLAILAPTAQGFAVSTAFLATNQINLKASSGTTAYTLTVIGEGSVS